MTHLKHIPGVSEKKARQLMSMNLPSVEAVARANASYLDKHEGVSSDLISKAQQTLPEWDDSRRYVESNRQEKSYCNYCQKEFSAVKFSTAESNRSVHEQGCGRKINNFRPMKESVRQFGEEV